MRFRIVNAYTDPSPAGTALRMASIVVVVCLAMLAIAIVAMHVEASEAKGGRVPSVPVSQSPRVCFPVGKWGPAPDRYAPCVRIRRVFEDGSFTYAVSDRDGTVRYSAGVGALDR